MTRPRPTRVARLPASHVITSASPQDEELPMPPSRVGERRIYWAMLVTRKSSKEKRTGALEVAPDR